MASGIDFTRIFVVLILFTLGMIFLLGYGRLLVDLVTRQPAEKSLAQKMAQTLCGYPFGQKDYYFSWQEKPDATAFFFDSFLNSLAGCLTPEVPQECKGLFAPAGRGITASNLPTNFERSGATVSRPTPPPSPCAPYTWDGNLTYYFAACPDYDLPGLSAYITCPNADCPSFAFETGENYKIVAATTVDLSGASLTERLLPDVCIRIEKTS